MFYFYWKLIEIKSFHRFEKEQWVLTTLEKLEDVLLIPSLDLEVALKDIYRNIEI